MTASKVAEASGDGDEALTPKRLLSPQGSSIWKVAPWTRNSQKTSWLESAKWRNGLTMVTPGMLRMARHASMRPHSEEISK